MIQIENLKKSYNGSRGLDGLSLRVEEGALFGIVGPNGAGKTTLIKILATLLKQQGGVARVDGMDVDVYPDEVRRLVGYLPDSPGVYQEMKVREFLEFFADAFQLGPKRREAVEKALEQAGLKDRTESFVEELSFGLRQKLCLAKTLLHDPKVLLLDEPATGLDPIARLELREMLRRLNASGVTILISSHILSDLEDICSHVALIAEGKNAQDEAGRSVLELRAPQPTVRLYEIEVLQGGDSLAKVAGALEGIEVLGSAERLLRVKISGGEAACAVVLRTLVEAGGEITRFDYRQEGLEERYQQAFARRPS